MQHMQAEQKPGHAVLCGAAEKYFRNHSETGKRVRIGGRDGNVGRSQAGEGREGKRVQFTVCRDQRMG